MICTGTVISFGWYTNHSGQAKRLALEITSVADPGFVKGIPVWQEKKDMRVAGGESCRGRGEAAAGLAWLAPPSLLLYCDLFLSWKSS